MLRSLGTPGSNHDVFMEFAKPAAMKVFEGIRDLGTMNTAHIHGQGSMPMTCSTSRFP